MEIETTEISVPGHKLIRPLLSGPNGSIYLAVRTTGGRQVLVRTFSPPLLTDDGAARADHARRVTGFLDAARVQQELAGHSKTWAAVYELGPLAGGDPGESGGAFFTTDLYPASLEWLIKAKVSVNGSVLQAVIAGVTAGLALIQKKCGRGHGNLIPVNVLLRRRDLRSPRVLLTDPHPDPSADAESDETDDRWAVGSLIYSLVLRRPVRRMMLLPVEMSDDWTALGRNAGKWLDLCNRLLSRNRADRPDLFTLAAEVAKLAEKDTRKAMRRRVLAAAVLAVVAAGGLAGYVHLYQSACDKLDTPAARQIRRIADAYQNGQTESDAAIRNAIDTDPSLVDLKSTLPGLVQKPGQTETDDTRKLIPSPAAFRQVSARRAALDRVQTLLDGKVRECLAGLRQAKKTAGDHQWATAGPPIDGLIAPLEKADWIENQQEIRVALVDGPTLIARVDAASVQWDRLSTGLQTTAGPGLVDPFFPGAAAAIKRDTAGRIHLDAGDKAVVDAAVVKWQSMQTVCFDAKSAVSGVAASMPPMWTGATTIPIALKKSDTESDLRQNTGSGADPVKQPDLKNKVVVVAPVLVDKATDDSYASTLRLASDEQRSLADPLIRPVLRDHLGKRLDDLIRRCVDDRANLKTDADLAAFRGDLQRTNDETIALAPRLAQAAAVEVWIRTGPLNQKLVEKRGAANQTVRSWVANPLPASDARWAYPQWKSAVDAISGDASAVAMTDDQTLFARCQADYDAWVKLVTPLRYSLSTESVLALDFPTEFGQARTRELCGGVAIDFASAPGLPADLVKAAVNGMSPAWRILLDFDKAYQARPAMTDLPGWRVFAARWFDPGPGKLQPDQAVLSRAPSLRPFLDYCATIEGIDHSAAKIPDGESDAHFTGRRRAELLTQTNGLKESGIDTADQMKSLICGILLCTDDSLDWPQNRDEFSALTKFCSTAETAVASADKSDFGKRLNGTWFTAARRKGWARLASHARTAEDLKAAVDLAAPAGVKIDKADEAGNPVELQAALADLPPASRDLTEYNFRVYLARKHGVMTTDVLFKAAAVLKASPKKSIADSIGPKPASADLKLVDDSWYCWSDGFKPTQLWTTPDSRNVNPNPVIPVVPINGQPVEVPIKDNN